MRSEQQVEAALKSYEDVDSWKTIIFLYNAALKEVGTKLEILNDEFQHVHQYNPIEHIKTRIKTPDSIVKKLKRYGYETSIENMVRYVNDIAGVRLICSFTSDIYRLAEMIGNQSDLKVLSIKDYIKNPKGVYLMIYKNVLLYSKENQVEIDFLEQMLSVLVPEMVIGRKDNVNIVSWLLTDYRMDTVDQIPELCDEEGNALKRDTRKKEGQEWGVLYKED